MAKIYSVWPHSPNGGPTSAGWKPTKVPVCSRQYQFFQGSWKNPPKHFWPESILTTVVSTVRVCFWGWVETSCKSLAPLGWDSPGSGQGTPNLAPPTCPFPESPCVASGRESSLSPSGGGGADQDLKVQALPPHPYPMSFTPRAKHLHAAAGWDLAAIPKPCNLRPGEAGDAWGTDDCGFSMGHALALLRVLKIPHVCGMSEKQCE